MVKGYLESEYMVITITDEGYVSNEEHIHKIQTIKAFSKTNPYDENLGLGIYLSSKILEKVGGSIEFSHNFPKGLIVKINFPINKI